MKKNFLVLLLLFTTAVAGLYGYNQKQRADGLATSLRENEREIKTLKLEVEQLHLKTEKNLINTMIMEDQSKEPAKKKPKAKSHSRK